MRHGIILRFWSKPIKSRIKICLFSLRVLLIFVVKNIFASFCRIFMLIPPSAEAKRKSRAKFGEKTHFFNQLRHPPLKNCSKPVTFCTFLVKSATFSVVSCLFWSFCVILKNPFASQRTKFVLLKPQDEPKISACPPIYFTKITFDTTACVN